MEEQIVYVLRQIEGGKKVSTRGAALLHASAFASQSPPWVVVADNFLHGCRKREAVLPVSEASASYG